MRMRKTTPILLLTASSLGHALQLFSESQPDTSLRKRSPELLETKNKDFIQDEPDSNPPARDTLRWRSSQDAPVDGLDGKPHAGPFVDPSRDDDVKAGLEAAKEKKTKPRPQEMDKWTQAGSGEWTVEDVPERNDGVMNDEARVGPKKGTDGTAGGISEKEKERRLRGWDGNKPTEPKAAPELPHSEQEWIEKEREETSGGKTKAGTGSGEAVKEGGEKEATSSSGKGRQEPAGLGLKKPSNLPEKPHNIPHPDPNPPKDFPTEDPWEHKSMPYTDGKVTPGQPKKFWQPKDKTKTLTTSTGEELEVPRQYLEPDEESWHEWFHSFVLSFTMIIFSEIGDKTFLVAALMAMRHARILVFSAAFGALIVMTVLSAVLGHAFPTILPKRLTTFAAAVLFLVFGARSLKEGLAMSPDEGVGEEMKEVEAELEEKEHSMARSRKHSDLSPYALESGRPNGHAGSRGRQPNIKPSEPSPPSSRSPSRSPKRKGSKDALAGLTNLLGLILSPAWVQTFVMTFLGEWGDRSQIATIAMAAGQDYWWVTLGAIAGHAICTGMAVIGGRALAGRVSLRVVTIGGAVAFLVFGVIYLFECLTE